MQKLENIGFYTLSNHRAEQTSGSSPMWRCEMILTGKCNFKCPYCRGLSVLSRPVADIDLSLALKTLDLWIEDGLKNIRFSGGEPTLYPYLTNLVNKCRSNGVEKIAISTNGSNNFDVYKNLIDIGVNDFSISLDACCSSFGNKMAGITDQSDTDQWNTVIENIRRISALTYVTVGVVLTKDNIANVKEIIQFAHDLGVADIRIISAAQHNNLLPELIGLNQKILDQHPILKYRVEHYHSGRNVRGIQEYDSHKCYLVQDDSVVAGQWHFPCVINMREGGEPIGKVSPKMRKDRIEWYKTHNSFEDPICRKNCLDVCIDYNNVCANMKHEQHIR